MLPMNRFLLAALLALPFMLSLSACAPPRDAIDVSQTRFDFGLNERPFFMDVWNKDPQTANLRIAITPLQNWIIVDARNLQSAAPQAANGPYDKRTLQISIDRRRLARGTHTGEIEFSAPGARPVIFTVTVRQDRDGQVDSLRFGETGVLFEYNSPYLVDFRFSLLDADDRAVVAEAAQFSLEPAENAAPLPPGTGVALKRAAARQLKVELLLDYTLSLQEAAGAIPAMENAAIDVFLPSLNEDALVGLTAFYRDDRPATRVVPFTVDRPFLRDNIRAIQQDTVGGFFSGARMYDAIYDAATRFTGDALNESRIILLFSDGQDTSSTRTANEAIARAKLRDVRVYAIGFGQNVNAQALINLATLTGGAYFPAASAGQLSQAFQRISEDLEGQYSLRWATLRRDAASVKPSFTLRLGQNSVFFEGLPFVPRDLGPEAAALQGILRVVPSSSETRTTVFLRANYVPRDIRRLRILFASTTPFSVRHVGFADDGLLAGWSITTQPDPDTGGIWVDARTNSVPIPFATFGPLLRIDFNDLIPENEPLFTDVLVDNTPYNNGQSFRVLGYEN